MDKKKFVSEVEDLLMVESGSISENGEFREEAEFFDSLIGFSLIVHFEETYGVKMTADEFIEQRSINALYEFCKARVE
jgi:acyl carrier protein